jgi:hypothetical protein
LRQSIETPTNAFTQNYTNNMNINPHTNKRLQGSLIAGMLLIVTLLGVQCSGNYQSATPITSISADGKVHFADGSEKEIPGFSDPKTIVMYAVRHCEKTDNNALDSSLSAEGKARAEKLGKVFDDARINRICSTAFKSSRETAEFLRYYAGDPPEEIFYPDSQNDWIENLLTEGGGKQYVYIGLRSSIPQLLNRLQPQSDFKNIPENEFNHLYVISTRGFGDTQIMDLQY